MKLKRALITIFDLVLVAMIILLTAKSMGLLTGFPKGNDAYAYLTKIRLINTYFPQINWNPFWDSGTPFSIWSYPPLPMTSTTFIFVRLLGFTPEKALIWMAGFSFIFLSWGIYGLVREATSRRLAGLLSVALFACSPASWNWWALGNYVRVFGLGFFGLSLWMLLAYLKRKELKQKADFFSWLALIFLSLAVSSHLLIGGITLVIAFLFILFISKQKGKDFFRFLVFPFLTAAYWYLPLFLTGKTGSRFIGINPGFPIPLMNWFKPVEAQEDFSLAPALSIGFLVSVFFLFFWGLLKRKTLSRTEKGSLIALGFFIIGNTAYNSLGYLPFYPKTFYIVGLPPIGAFSLTSLAWAIGAGLFWGLILSKGWKKARLGNLILFVFIIMGLVNLYWGRESLKAIVRDLSEYGTTQDLVQQVVTIKDPQEFNYRFANDSGHVADWFTYKYDMPQTRDYFAQGIPHVNWQNWLETAVWYWDDNYGETNFLLDWYGVKEIFITEPHFNYDKFLARPDFYEITNHKVFVNPPMTLYQFGYRQSKPILSATNAPVILVVGAKTEYDVFLRTLGLAGLGPDKVIPVFMEKPVDKLSAADLKKFQALFLYNYTYRDEKRFQDLLAEYLSSGGQVFIETFRGEEKEKADLFDWLPVKQTKAIGLKPDWQLKATEHEIAQGIDFYQFSDLSYPGGLWQVSSGELSSGSEVVLETPEGILMASKKINGGKIFWSGMNFPFHLADRKNPEEIELWQNIFQWFGIKEEAEIAFSQAEFINPEKRIITINQPAQGILFKETKFMDWQTKDRQIFFAGPGFMYVFLGGINDWPTTITFNYCLSWLEKISFLIAVLAWLYLIFEGLEIVFKKRFLTSRFQSSLTKKTSRLTKKMASWWDEEE